MTHLVEHQPQHASNGWPWTVSQHPDRPGGTPIRCASEFTATRVAQALDLLDAHEGKYDGDPKIFSRAVPLPEAEIMQRAREAAIKAGIQFTGSWQTVDTDERGRVIDRIRLGNHDNQTAISAAASALRDLSKPLSEIVPKPVDPDLIEARKIAADALRNCEMPTMIASIERGDEDQAEIVKATLAAIKRGREMGLGELFTDEGVKKVQRALRE